jgi:hypothetical protein
VFNPVQVFSTISTSSCIVLQLFLSSFISQGVPTQSSALCGGGILSHCVLSTSSFNLHCYWFLLHKPPHIFITDNVRSKSHVHKCLQVPCDSLCNLPHPESIQKRLDITSTNCQICCNKYTFL